MIQSHLLCLIYVTSLRRLIKSNCSKKLFNLTRGNCRLEEDQDWDYTVSCQQIYLLIDPHPLSPAHYCDRVTLSVSKGIVDLHRGRVAVESAGEGKGSTFSLELPLFRYPPGSGPQSMVERAERQAQHSPTRSREASPLPRVGLC